MSNPGRSILAPAIAISAGTRVSATNSATTTTLTPAAPTARRIFAWNSSRPDRLIATVTPENSTVRPAVRMVITSASVRAALVDRVVTRSRWCRSSSRYRETISRP